MRLHGIDAPEAAQTCKDASGRDYACGERATARLRGLAENRRVTCEGREFDQYKRFLAVCRVGGVEINRTMVAEGHAWAFVRFSNDYVATEQETRAARRGVFAAANTRALGLPVGRLVGGAGDGATAERQLPDQGQRLALGRADLPHALAARLRARPHGPGRGQALVLRRERGRRGGLAEGGAVSAPLRVHGAIAQMTPCSVRRT